MSFHVFRNNTVERFFPKDYTFSGYDDISSIPKEVDGYIWFYQLPIKSSEEVICKELDSYAGKLTFVLEQVKPSKPFIIITVENCYSLHVTNGLSVLEAINRYNSAILEAEQSHSNVKVLDISEFSRQFPLNEFFDWKYWFISQMGMNPRLAKPFLEWFARKTDQIQSRRKKCIVLDLDNTLWGGILGEDGAEGIKVGGDYPGKAFLFFQEVLLELCKNGVILSICSKNNESDAWDVLENHPYMVLRKDHFSSWRINWKDKASNIREIAQELNIGLDSLVFVDDNPSERELVRQALPMVAVPDFPEQPYLLPAFCKDVIENYFRVYSITAEDKDKVAQYKANAQRLVSQRSFTDLDSFIKSLDIHIRIEKANAFSIPRIAQMTQKTNQFNLTTKRYTEADISSFLDQGWGVFCMSVSDRFGDSGITGCVFINGQEVDSLLLSCRILGKDIEYAFIKSILKEYKEKGYRTISARYIPSPKNSQVECFYENCGFSLKGSSPSGEKEYEIDLNETDLAIKPLYSITLND